MGATRADSMTVVYYRVLLYLFTQGILIAAISFAVFNALLMRVQCFFTIEVTTTMVASGCQRQLQVCLRRCSIEWSGESSGSVVVSSCHFASSIIIVLGQTLPSVLEINHKTTALWIAILLWKRACQGV